MGDTSFKAYRKTFPTGKILNPSRFFIFCDNENDFDTSVIKMLSKYALNNYYSFDFIGIHLQCTERFDINPIDKIFCSNIYDARLIKVFEEAILTKRYNGVVDISPSWSVKNSISPITITNISVDKDDINKKNLNKPYHDSELVPMRRIMGDNC